MKKQKIEFTVVGLNPCFNGRCTRTRFNNDFNRGNNVLILVLMEDALVHYEQGVYCRLCWRVLILVLMEDALVLKYVTSRLRYSFGLNPCFNGRCTRTLTSRTI